MSFQKLFIASKQLAVKRINHFISKLDAMPNFKLTAERKQLRKDLSEILNNISLFRDSDLEGILRAASFADLFAAVKILKSIITERETLKKQMEQQLIADYQDYCYEMKYNSYWDDFTQSWLTGDEVKKEDLAQNGGSVYKQARKCVSLESFIKAGGNIQKAWDIELGSNNDTFDYFEDYLESFE